MSQPYKECPQCKMPAALQELTCQRCGHVFRTAFAPPPNQTVVIQRPGKIIRVAPGSHSTTTALMLCFLPGMAQYFNLQYKKANIIALVFWICVICWPLIFLFSGLLHLPLVIMPIMWITALVIWPVQFVDGLMIAGKLNRGEAVGYTEWF